MNHRLSYFVKLARPALALAVAYAFALQMLLASVMAAAIAATPQAGAAVICYGGANGSGGQPVHSPGHPADCALHCAHGLGAAAILPPDHSSVPVFVSGRQRQQPVAAAFVLTPRPSPKRAQAPPQNA